MAIRLTILTDESGASAVEYSLIVSLIAVVIFMAVQDVGTGVLGLVKSVCSAMGQAAGAGDCL